MKAKLREKESERVKGEISLKLAVKYEWKMLENAPNKDYKLCNFLLPLLRLLLLYFPVQD